MNFKGILRFFNFFDLVNKYKYNLLKRFLLLKYYDKKRIILQKSYCSNFLLKSFFKKSLDFEKFRKIFFNKNIFPHSNDLEKKFIISLLQDNCKDEIQKYLEYANITLNKEFHIFEKKHKFDKEINWHYSLFNDYYWPVIKSNEIQIHPKNESVDVKYVWEFNRHQFMIYLGFGYYITKDRKYALAFKNQILDWIKKNPPLYGINWYSCLEISIRLTSWIYTLLFFKDSKDINNTEFFKKIFRSMFTHAYFLKYFYTRRSFNHTVGDLFGLYLFSKIFEEIKPIKRWEKIFFKKFKKQITLQTREDGVNIEQAINYHRVILEYFSLFLIINPNSLNEKELNLIEKMYDYLLFVCMPNKKFPLIGDSDEGKVLLLTFYEDDLFHHVINLGSILFRRKDLKYISKGISPISIILLGAKGFETYNKLRIQEPNKIFGYFKNTGYIIIRNNWNDNASYLFVDFGRFGPRDANHSHSSITNFIYSHKGKDIIIDSGTYTYNKSWTERNYFRSSKAHNVLTINQKNQAKIISWFDWKDKPKIKRNIEFNNNEIGLTCSHDGYKGFIVKRRIITNKNLDNLLIKDSIFQTQDTINGELCGIDIYFHFDKNANLKIENNSLLINNELCFKITSNSDFQINLKRSLYSPKYGFKYENKVLNVHLTHDFKNKNIIEIETKINPLN